MNAKQVMLGCGIAALVALVVFSVTAYFGAGAFFRFGVCLSTSVATKSQQNFRPGHQLVNSLQTATSTFRKCRWRFSFSDAMQQRKPPSREPILPILHTIHMLQLSESQIAKYWRQFHMGRMLV